MYFYHSNGTRSNTIYTSFRKAYTATSVKVPTYVLSQIIESTGCSQLGKMENNILLLTGELPIFYN